MGDEDQESPRSGNALLWPLRALLHTIIKLLVLVVMAVRTVLTPRPIRYGLLILVVAGGIGWDYANRTFQEQQLAATLSGDVVSTTATAQLPPSPTVENYLKAQATYDARGMWESISDDLKMQLQAASGSPQQLQVELDSAKAQGRRYAGAVYIGGVPIQGGNRVYFYVLRVESPVGTSEVPYIYVVGPDGKIESIQ